MAFIAGSFAALLLAVALLEDTLLERHLYGHTLVRGAYTRRALAPFIYLRYWISGGEPLNLKP